MDIPSIDYLLDETAKNGQPIWQVVLREGSWVRERVLKWKALVLSI
mgnify:CR=1 FL=1